MAAVRCPIKSGAGARSCVDPTTPKISISDLKQLYFDTALYNIESLKLLFRICGPERCLFGTERPGAGSKTDPRTGKWYDDVRPNIERSPGSRRRIRQRSSNRTRCQVFSRFKQ